MSKSKRQDLSAREFDSEFDPAASADKMPTNVAGSVTFLRDFIEIPCDKVVEYQGKKSSDFKPWPEERFKVLVDSIRAQGILEPTIVRHLQGKPGYYEMLAGEHRWKAAREIGLKTIPAHLLLDCDDEKANSVFTITNVLRRENSIKDKINGWWHYVNVTKYRSSDEIDQMITDGFLSSEVYDKAKSGMRTVYMYAKLHDLIDELLDLVDQKQISIVAGEQLAFLTHQQQTDLLPYKRSLNNKDRAKQLKELAANKIEGKIWNDENIKQILFPERSEKVLTLGEIGTRVRTLIGDKIIQSAYGSVEKIVSDALDSYLEEHPEFKKREKKDRTP